MGRLAGVGKPDRHQQDVWASVSCADDRTFSMNFRTNGWAWKLSPGFHGGSQQEKPPAAGQQPV
jgi:hypothetical protein